MLEQLEAIVTELGAELVAWRETGLARGTWQGTQLKTEADLRAHGVLSKRLTALAPGVPVISEEDSRSHRGRRPDRYFLIDPIDGTASFGGGFPGYVTQIALMETGGPVQAAIRAPALGLSYLAERGCGATLNGARLRTGSRPGQTVLIDNHPEPRGFARRVFQGLPCTGYVESGSISLKVCRVADGTADIFVKDVTVRDWDLAAPHLVLAEAGGVLALLDGSTVPYHGPYERKGLVAARTTQIRRRFAAWLRHDAPEPV